MEGSVPLHVRERAIELATLQPVKLFQGEGLSLFEEKENCRASGPIEENVAREDEAETEAGVHGFTRALAVDLGKDGIRCNAIAPGWINSDLSNDYINAQENPEQARQDLYALHPIGRTGEPGDIGSMVAFLASNQAGFVTGQTFVVDGGRTAKLPLPF